MSRCLMMGPGLFAIANAPGPIAFGARVLRAALSAPCLLRVSSPETAHARPAAIPLLLASIRLQ